MPFFPEHVDPLSSNGEIEVPFVNVPLVEQLVVKVLVITPVPGVRSSTVMLISPA